MSVGEDARAHGRKKEWMEDVMLARNCDRLRDGIGTSEGEGGGADCAWTKECRVVIGGR